MSFRIRLNRQHTIALPAATALRANLFQAALVTHPSHKTSPRCFGVMKRGDNAVPHVEMRKIGRFA
jgi:hypothetical protein